jgi:gluconate 2-dehydrogenase gamma chain
MINRRDSIKLLAFASLATVIPGCTPSDIEQAAEKAAGAVSDGLEGRQPTVLNPHDYETVRVLVDYIIPRDDRSGSASDAAVPEFIDFLLEDVEDMQTPVLGGLAWLDHQCRTENGNSFIECDVAQQRSLLDRIAYPNAVDDDLKAGADFFSTMRDLTASGFFSSKMGVEDLQYQGNVARPEWTGCSDDAMTHLGLSYNA